MLIKPTINVSLQFNVLDLLTQYQENVSLFATLMILKKYAILAIEIRTNVYLFV